MRSLCCPILLALGALLISGCMFNTESVGDLPDGTYVTAQVLDGPGYKRVWHTSLRFSFRHFEEITIDEIETGTYRGDNDANNSRSKLIFKSKGTYSVRNDTLYLEIRSFGAASIASYDLSVRGTVPYDPDSFTPEKVSYSIRFSPGASISRSKLDMTPDGFFRTIFDAADSRLEKLEYRKSVLP